MLKSLGITYYNPVSTGLFTNVTRYVYKLIQPIPLLFRKPHSWSVVPVHLVPHSPHLLKCILTFSCDMPVFQVVLFPAGFRTRLLFAFLIFQPCMPLTPSYPTLSPPALNDSIFWVFVPCRGRSSYLQGQH